MSKIIRLRAETKENERRTPLSPRDAKKLKEAGAKIFVEDSDTRIFSNEDYKAAGCEIAPFASWKTADKAEIILGLKELPEESTPLIHQHIFFAHAYKGQTGSKEILSRFKSGGGTLFDLEYLTDKNSRRIAAFGKWAGFVGAAVAVGLYCDKKYALKSYENQDELIEQLKALLIKRASSPSAMIIGARGRCGNGAIELFNHCGISSTNWDSEHTRKGGPFQEIKDHNIFLNAVLMTFEIPPFLTKEFLSSDQKLQIVCDVSCDPTSALNPIPIYDSLTTWENPSQTIEFKDGSLELISVDNLPSALPLESSLDFSEQLTPHLIELINSESLPIVWENAFNCYNKFSN